MANLIQPDGSMQQVVPANPVRGFTLDELYALLGCEMIETIELAGDLGETMVIDEEGKFNRPRKVNPRATILLHQAGGMLDDYIVGPALIVSGKELQ